MKFSKIKLHNIFLTIIQVVFWICTAIFFVKFSFIRPCCVTPPIFEVASVALIAAMVYLNYSLLYPVFIKRKWFYFIITSLFSLLIITICEFFFFQNDIIRSFHDSKVLNEYKISVFLLIFLRDLGFLLFFLLFKHYRNAIKSHKLKMEMLRKEMEWEKEKFEIEKSFIRSKMGPHYLFNVVNQLYVLAVKKNENLPHLMRKLSAILDFYMIESNKNQIDLDTEIDFYRDYIDLELLRHPNNIDVNFNVDGEAAEIMLSPLIYENFIGNAFKYTCQDGTGSINIHFDLRESGMVKFYIENNKPEINNKCASSQNGLKIVEKRLQLLYPNRYEWFIEDENNNYKVFLNLKID